MKICHHQGCNGIGVVIATKRLPPPITYFTSAMIRGTGTVHRSFFLQYGRLDVREV